jgi:signal transduction histidine kinase
VASIVNDLLSASRAEAGTVVIVSQDVSVRSVVGDVLSSHSGRVGFSTSSGEDATVWADPGRVRQILRNLLTNAERYGGDIVQIHVKKVGAQVMVEVRDDGEGILLRQRHLIFEPYTRAERGSREPDSVGLGLSVARKLAELMDGTLELSRDSGWTVFSLGLPASRVDLREPVATQPVGTPELQAG